MSSADLLNQKVVRREAELEKWSNILPLCIVQHLKVLIFEFLFEMAFFANLVIEYYLWKKKSVVLKFFRNFVRGPPPPSASLSCNNRAETLDNVTLLMVNLMLLNFYLEILFAGVTIIGDYFALSIFFAISKTLTILIDLDSLYFKAIK